MKFHRGLEAAHAEVRFSFHDLFWQKPKPGASRRWNVHPIKRLYGISWGTKFFFGFMLLGEMNTASERLPVNNPDQQSEK